VLKSQQKISATTVYITTALKHTTAKIIVWEAIDKICPEHNCNGIEKKKKKKEEVC